MVVAREPPPFSAANEAVDDENHSLRRSFARRFEHFGLDGFHQDHAKELDRSAPKAQSAFSASGGESIKVFTTRPDTLLAPQPWCLPPSTRWWTPSSQTIGRMGHPWRGRVMLRLPRSGGCVSQISRRVVRFRTTRKINQEQGVYLSANCVVRSMERSTHLYSRIMS